jgi:putative ABC transport system permease protein
MIVRTGDTLPTRSNRGSRQFVKMQPVMISFRRAVRSLRKAPALAAVAIASLALGIGANVTVFSVVREMILDDVSARRPDRLAQVEGIDVSYTLYRQLRTAGAFEDLAFNRGFCDLIWRTANRSEIVWRLTTSTNFFDVLGVHALAGRLYSQAD